MPGARGSATISNWTTFETRPIGASATRDGCVDEIMLADLEERILESSQDMFIVMHRAGSHGPAYYRRYPDEFRVFAPECRSDAPESCTTEELINSYDNSILYTDHFLDRLIDILDGLSAERSVSMIYASDHGESLGENGLFLHGLPYAIAPESQTHVPMIMWVPATFAGNGAALRNCLQERATEKLSHDNLFPTMLSLSACTRRTRTAR
ncbi:MAG: sulfatase-like hydrolase/transferase [Gammaproteobacteria bacterium]|nr:sulfatase-like hydrolase/transferase [Gammaproteobacteria bacterium]